MFMNNYDAIIIGFGKGGKTLAAALGAAGKRTVLIEKSPKMYGGTCINVGCIPTKYLVHKAQEAWRTDGFDAKAVLYEKAIDGKNALTENLRAKNLKKLENIPNVTVMTGTVKFRSAHEVEVSTEAGTQLLTGETIFVNTGSVPVIPPVDGLKNNPRVFVSESLLNLKTLPRKLVIIGGGYIGVEFASIYAGFGSKVTVIQNGTRFLPREDEDIADAVLKNLQSRGVQVLTDAVTQSVASGKDYDIVTVQRNDEIIPLEADAVLVATGRRPNTAELGLENAGVETAPNGGIITNEHLRSSVPNIYAMGDVVGGLQFTYISLDDYRVVRSAVLGDGSYNLARRGAVPYSVFLEPPFSRIGLSEEDAKKQGYSVKVTKLPAAAIPKAMVLEQTDGLLKAVIDGKTGLILGVHLFCAESHEIINIVKPVMDAKLPYTALRDMIFTHPTMGEALNDLFQVG